MPATPPLAPASTCLAITGARNLREAVAAAQRFRPSNPAANNRKPCQNHQRHGHRTGRFVDVMFDFMVNTRLSKERHVHQAEHIKRRHSSGDEADQPQEVCCIQKRGPGSRPC